MAPGHPMGNGRFAKRTLHAAGAWHGLNVAVQLAGGEWLSFVSVLPEKGHAISRQFVLSMIFMAATILLVSVWAVRRVTRPLGGIAEAAERLGKDIEAPPLDEVGTLEMRRAVQAFNGMQERLRRFIQDRTRMLAAISHDLRTPLTTLRLRSENVDNIEERTKMLATIAEMTSMVEATLSFARDEASTEPHRRIDLTALVASVVDDLTEAGKTVTMTGKEEEETSIIYECEPGALKRALSNLVENAVNYAGAAQVSLRDGTDNIEIAVEDDGPGIPEEALSQVFQPFYRLEESRSRETGGVGLGLAIARSVVQAHGGDLSLSNRPEGGLRATILLPLTSQSEHR